ncbi:hypothetical protein Tco_0990362 [Tanacetum coccineum]|uniref:Uncharacterized protein n=1 Tax=Tanacetum coccineum TaxID=301880 RepID=A0ABQ5EX18_9ASTR
MRLEVLRYSTTPAQLYQVATVDPPRLDGTASVFRERRDISDSSASVTHAVQSPPQTGPKMFEGMPVDQLMEEFDMVTAQQAALVAQLRARFSSERSRSVQKDEEILLLKTTSWLAKSSGESRGLQGSCPCACEFWRGEGKNNHFAGLEEFRQRVEGLLEKQEEKLRKLSIEYDEELYPHMLSAIAERKWLISHAVHWHGGKEEEAVGGTAENKLLDCVLPHRNFNPPAAKGRDQAIVDTPLVEWAMVRNERRYEDTISKYDSLRRCGVFAGYPFVMRVSVALAYVFDDMGSLCAKRVDAILSRHRFFFCSPLRDLPNGGIYQSLGLADLVLVGVLNHVVLFRRYSAQHTWLATKVSPHLLWLRKLIRAAMCSHAIRVRTLPSLFMVLNSKRFSASMVLGVSLRSGEGTAAVSGFSIENPLVLSFHCCAEFRVKASSASVVQRKSPFFVHFLSVLNKGSDLSADLDRNLFKPANFPFNDWTSFIVRGEGSWMTAFVFSGHGLMCQVSDVQPHPTAIHALFDLNWSWRASHGNSIFRMIHASRVYVPPPEWP